MGKPESEVICPKPFEEKVSGYCYSSHGSYKLAAIFSNDQYLVGDTASMNIAVDATQAETDIKSLRVALMMHTRVEAKGVTNEQSTEVTSIMLPGIAKGTSRVDMNCIPVQMKITTKGELQASANGNIVKNTFSLTILGEVDGCVCYSKNPQTSIPVFVYNMHYGPQAVPQMNQMVNNWQPQSYDPYVCQMNSQFRMTSDFKNKLYIDQPVQMPEQ